MFEKLRQKASAYFGGDEVDRILALPITQIRLDLKKAFNEKKFSAEDFEGIVERLRDIDPTIDAQVDVVREAIAKREVADALDIELNSPAKTALWAAAFMRLMEEGDTPLVKSRIWEQMQDSIGVFNEGIRVARVISSSLSNKDATFDWGQPGSWFYYDPRTNHINLDMFMTLMMGFEHMRVVHLHEIGHSELSNTFPPRMREIYDKIKVIIDPESLTADEKKALREKPKATQEEQQQMMADAYEWQLRFMLWHMVEDNCVNQFAVNMEKLVPIQDFAASWNHVGVTLQGYGELARGDNDKLPEDVTSDMPRARSVREKIDQVMEKMAEAERKRQMEEFQKLVSNPLSDSAVKDIKAGKITPQIARRMFHMNKTAVWLAFYERTGLFNDSDKGWAKFKVFKEDINRTVDVSAIPEARGMTAFEYLYEKSVGPQGISHQQPKPRDRLFGAKHYQAKVDESTAARNAIMEELWDLYLKPYADVMMAEQQQNLKNRQDQKNQHKGQQQNQQGQQGGQQGQQSQQSGGGGQGEPQQKQQSQGGGGQPSEQGSPSTSSQGEKSQQSSNGGQQDDQKQDQSGASGQDKDEQERSGQEKDQQQENGAAGEDKKEQDQQNDQQQSNTQQSQQPKEELDEELQEKIKDMAATPHDKKEKEHKNDEAEAKAEAERAKQEQEKQQQQGADGQDKQDSQQQDQSGQGAKPGWQQDPEAEAKPKKADDMKDKAEIGQEMTDQDKERLQNAMEAMQKSGMGAASSSAGMSANDIDLSKLAKGDWRDFEKRALELSPVVNQVARSFEMIRARQSMIITNMSKAEHELIASDGDLRGRFDRDKRLQRDIKKATKQRMDIDDFKVFRTDQSQTAFASIEMTFMIDGSGSMPTVRLAGGITAMEAALQSAAIMYLAARKAGIDAYIVMWGDAKPVVIANPDTPFKEVGQKLETLRNGTNSGTSLSPAICTTIKEMAEYKAKPGTISGSSHIFVYSDGDIGDRAQAYEDLMTVARYGKNISVDVAVLRPSASDAKTQMENVFDGVANETGGRCIGTLRGHDPNEIPRELARTVLRRVNAAKIEGQPDAHKRKQLSRLSQKLST